MHIQLANPFQMTKVEDLVTLMVNFIPKIITLELLVAGDSSVSQTYPKIITLELLVAGNSSVSQTYRF